MAAIGIQHVSVWIDERSQAEGALSEATRWAGSLGVPLRAVLRASENHVQVRSTAHDIPVETVYWTGDLDNGVRQCVRPSSLCVFDEDQSDTNRQRLLEEALRGTDIWILLTPPVARPMKRILIVNNETDTDSSYIEVVARLCQALKVEPLILTLAHSEEAANARQSFAAGVCACLRLQADLDAVVAGDLASAVERVAAWRECSHVIFPRSRKNGGTSLWHRGRSDTFSQLRHLANSLTLLAVPENSVGLAPTRTETSLRHFERENLQRQGSNSLGSKPW
jgi:hypothetical protein